jgi:hypothetical protein
MFLECSRAQTSKDTRNALASTTRLPRLPARLCTCPYSTQGFSSASSCSQAPPLSPRFVSRPAHLQQQLNDGANHQPSHTSRGRNRQPWTSFLIARWLSHPGWTCFFTLHNTFPWSITRTHAISPGPLPYRDSISCSVV